MSTRIILDKKTLENSVQSRIEAEKDSGNHEYKLTLSAVSQNKIEKITTQMRYRLDEGHGEAYYTLGVLDDGGVVGITEEDYKINLKILQTVADKNNYIIKKVAETELEKGKKMYEFLVRENNSKKYIDIKVACAGNVDSGKSTLLGVLLSGKNDDGRGSARLNVFNFIHEMRSGKTSSVAQHILGFDKDGNPVNYDDSLGRKKSWPDIVNHSAKIVTFFDLCGHEKYLKTTIRGLTSQSPDIVLILIGGNMGVSKMTKEHIFLCLSLHIPFAVVITKIDMMENRRDVFSDTIRDIKALLKNPFIRRIPFDIKSDSDVLLATKTVNNLQSTPIFYVSNVSGEGVDYLRNFFNLYSRSKKEVNEKSNVELHIDSIFQVVGVGNVIGGQLVSGKINIGDKLLIGPENEKYYTITVRSIHCKRVPVEQVEEGAYVCLSIKKQDELILRRGQVVISMIDKPIQVREFLAEVAVLRSNSTTVKKGYQPVLHTCGVRQSSIIEEICSKECNRGKEDEKSVLRTGDRAVVKFRFAYNSEYVKPGWRILLAEGQVKVIGKIIKTFEEQAEIN